MLTIIAKHTPDIGNASSIIWLIKLFFDNIRYVGDKRILSSGSFTKIRKTHLRVGIDLELCRNHNEY